MTCWVRCGFDHRLGSADCFSISASCGRTFSASKILPKFVEFLIQFFVFEDRLLINEEASAFLRFLKVLRWCEAHEQRSNRNYRTGVGEPVAMTRVERRIGSKGIGCDEGSALLARNSCDDSSPGIDGGCDTGVGRAQKPTVIFDSAPARLVEMLRVGTAVAVPTIIGNVHEDLRTLIGKLAHFIGKNRFIA